MANMLLVSRQENYQQLYVACNSGVINAEIRIIKQTREKLKLLKDGGKEY